MGNNSWHQKPVEATFTEMDSNAAGLNQTEADARLLKHGPNELIEKKKKSRYFSRSLFIVENIARGEPLTEKNIRSIRPGLGMEPKYLPLVLGKKARKNLDRGTPLSWSDMEE